MHHTTSPLKGRIASIDVFIALTMFLMVFVNDLWTDIGIPAWLEHAPANADAMGFSDIIFPSFLFLVGLSLPFAQTSRQMKGASRTEQFTHIVSRSLALIIMGFFQMNMEMYSPKALLPKGIWIIIVTSAFFLIWLDYSKEKRNKKAFQGMGIFLLVAMAIIYKGESNGKEIWMQPHWWGILGLIGWAYFSCATILLWAQDRIIIPIAAFLFFLFFNSSVLSGWPGFLEPIRHAVGRLGLGNASNASITMAGVLISLLYRKWAQKPQLLVGAFVILAVVLFAFGFSTHPLWGISKIRATPSWTMICTAISILTFLVLIFLMDRMGKEKWFKIIRPAGTSTLTCYLLPYFHLAIFISLLKLRLPEALRTGGIGIIKSLLFALAIVMITGLLEKIKLRLKI